MLQFLKLRKVNELSLDDPKRTILHGEIIRSKKFLKRLYIDWYRKIWKLSANKPEGRQIELGAGAGFIQELYPQVETSDVLQIPDLDMVFDALNMPFDNESIAAFFMIDVFHHVSDSHAFLKELERCLKNNGCIVMSEPCVSWWSKLIFKNFHHEPFDERAGWTLDDSGPMSSANGALPWIVFRRDRDLFQKRFPNLKLELTEFHSPLSYLLSGGVSMKQLVPSWSFPLVRSFERIMSRLFPMFALFQFIVIRKTQE
jgi:SAM-dependent methyltransferase